MAINTAEQNLDGRFIKQIAQMQRDIREIKNIQPVGADVLTTIGVPSNGPSTAGPVTVNAGSSITFVTTIIPASELLTLWNFAFTLYVDVLDNAHQWTPGSALNSNSRELFMFNWLDWADSGDIVNARTYKVRIRNSDPGGNPHDYYLDIRAYVPKLATG